MTVITREIIYEGLSRNSTQFTLNEKWVRERVKFADDLAPLMLNPITYLGHGLLFSELHEEVQTKIVETLQKVVAKYNTLPGVSDDDFNLQDENEYIDGVMEDLMGELGFSSRDRSMYDKVIRMKEEPTDLEYDKMRVAAAIQAGRVLSSLSNMATLVPDSIATKLLLALAPIPHTCVIPTKEKLIEEVSNDTTVNADFSWTYQPKQKKENEDFDFDKFASLLSRLGTGGKY